MIDENAYGILIAYYDVEDDEYALERGEFVDRFEAFRGEVLRYLTETPLAEAVRGVDLGHAVYVEVGEGDETAAPIAWLRSLRGVLDEKGFRTVGVLSHGSRWVDEEGEVGTSTEWAGTAALMSISRPSEPFRRALYADAASRPDDDDDEVGWGPGLYLDVEAVEALGKQPKNEPTVLRASGVSYYRAGS
jgi:hypothetical protein